MRKTGINVSHCRQTTIAPTHVGILFASAKTAPLASNPIKGTTMYKWTCPEFGYPGIARTSGP
jgi:hypothetical protein